MTIKAREIDHDDAVSKDSHCMAMKIVKIMILMMKMLMMMMMKMMMMMRRRRRRMEMIKIV